MGFDRKKYDHDRAVDRRSYSQRDYSYNYRPNNGHDDRTGFEAQRPHNRDRSRSGHREGDDRPDRLKVNQKMFANTVSNALSGKANPRKSSNESISPPLTKTVKNDDNIPSITRKTLYKNGMPVKRFINSDQKEGFELANKMKLYENLNQLDEEQKPKRKISQRHIQDPVGAEIYTPTPTPTEEKSNQPILDQLLFRKQKRTFNTAKRAANPNSNSSSNSPQKFTVTNNYADGTSIETHTGHTPKVSQSYDNDDRRLLVESAYGTLINIFF